MPSIVTTVLYLLALVSGPVLAADTSHDSLELLWPDGAPEAKGDAITDQPALSIHLPPKGKANGAAVVVNPGGGYHVLAADHEGLQMARALNRQGITAFVLRYRLLPDYQATVALLDGKRAMRYVRFHAKRFGIDPNRVGMLGSSAGGHLTAAVGTSFDLMHQGFVITDLHRYAIGKILSERQKPRLMPFIAGTKHHRLRRHLDKLCHRVSQHVNALAIQQAADHRKQRNFRFVSEPDSGSQRPAIVFLVRQPPGIVITLDIGIVIRVPGIRVDAV